MKKQLETASYKLLNVAGKIVYDGLIFVIVTILTLSGVFYADIAKPNKADAVDTARMLVMWDDTDASIPTGSGWSKVTSLGGNSITSRYPRGEAPSNALQQGGSATHSPTATVTNITSASLLSNGTATGSRSAAGHTHTSANPTIGSANNDPSHRTLKIIQYDSGIPSTIPSGGIVMFDGNPGAGWTRVSAQDDKMLKAETGASISTGGSDTHTHTITWPNLVTGSDLGSTDSGSGNASAFNGHGHTVPATTTATNGTSAVDCDALPGCLPPHVKPLLYKANSNIAVPNGIISMFDANPGGGWAVQSNPGGIFYQQFIRPASTFSATSNGSSTHSHVNATVTSADCGCGTTTGGGTAAASSAHTHTITATFSSNTSNTPQYFNVVIAKKSLPGMLLFWDGTDASIPSGWVKVTAYDGRLPRGDIPANSGDVGGNASAHTHTNNSISVDSTASTNSANFISGNGASVTHTHGLGSVSLTALGNSSLGTNLPAYRALKLIKYNDGTIPTEIPAGAISIFDNSPGIPTAEYSPGNPYWTRYSAQDNKFLAIDNDDADVGSTTSLGSGADSHTHNTSWTGTLANTNSTQLLNCTFCGATNAASTTHNHTVTGSNNSNTGTSPGQTSGETIPPHVKILMAKANTNIPTISLGIIAMFDGDPGSGWVIRSAPGGTFNKRFFRPASSYSQPTNPTDLCDNNFGCTHHTHISVKNSNGPSATVNNTAASGTAAGSAHTHAVTASFTTGSSEANYISNNEYFIPPYFNVVVAEKVDFKLSNYQWFDNSNDSENVTSGWSSLDLLQDVAIATLPTANDPPTLGTRLRLRIKLQVNNANLAANEKQFRLQYKKSFDNLCDSAGGWAEVGSFSSGEVWRFANSNITDGTALTQSKLSSDVLQLYSKSNPTGLNINAIVSGQYMEYDFHIEHNGAVGASQYSFRVVEENGTLFSEYTYCPTLVTAPASGDIMRHGNFFESSSGTDGRERGFFWAN